MNKILTLLSLLFIMSCSNTKEPDATGTFEATEVIISSETAGKVISFTASEGDVVTKGSQIAVIDTIQLNLQKRRAESSLKAVSNRRQDIPKQIAATQQQIENAIKERDRFSNLIASNAATTKQLDDINYQLEVLKKQLSAQKSALESSNLSLTNESEGLKIQIDQINDQISRCYLKSPVDGVVLSKYCEEGEFAYQGKPMFKVADTKKMILRAYITADQLVNIKTGMDVSVLTDDSDGKYKTYSGKISSISDKAEFTPKTIQTKNERTNLVYAVKVLVENDGFLRIGMYGDIIFNK